MLEFSGDKTRVNLMNLPTKGLIGSLMQDYAISTVLH